MDILQLPTECIQHIINQLKIKKYNQYHLVNNWKPESHRDELNYNCIVSKPLKIPGFVRLDKKKYCNLRYEIIYLLQENVIKHKI